MKIELVERLRNDTEKNVMLQLIITGTSYEAENKVVCVQSPMHSEPFCFSEIIINNLKKDEIQSY